MTAPRIITITSDFGTSDEYVGVMKGVILSRYPEAKIVDITHDINPGDIKRAAFLLGRTVPFFPLGTVHLVVVDPGVGSTRRAVALRTGENFFVAPDNGVLSVVLDMAPEWTMVSLENPTIRLQPVSSTFHGRDIFAPAAAYLAAGGEFPALGPRVPQPVHFPIPRPEVQPEQAIDGEVLYGDNFGNLVTNIPRELVLSTFGSDIGNEFTITIAGRKILAICSSYAAASTGSLVTIFGSDDTLEISISGGSAAKTLDIGTGARVKIVWKN